MSSIWGANKNRANKKPSKKARPKLIGSSTKKGSEEIWRDLNLYKLQVKMISIAVICFFFFRLQVFLLQLGL